MASGGDAEFEPEGHDGWDPCCEGLRSPGAQVTVLPPMPFIVEVAA